MCDIYDKSEEAIIEDMSLFIAMLQQNIAEMNTLVDTHKLSIQAEMLNNYDKSKEAIIEDMNLFIDMFKQSIAEINTLVDTHKLSIQAEMLMRWRKKKLEKLL